MRSATARRPRSRRARARLATVVSATGALLLAVTVVWQSASAGFTDPTAPVRVTVGSGTVSLSDNDSGTALFSVAGLKPGDSVPKRCITVTSTGTAPADVRVHAALSSVSRSLPSYLDVTVRFGTGSCTSFASQGTAYSGRLSGFPGSWSAATTNWSTTAAGQSRVYEISATLVSGTPSSVGGGSADVTFTWEAQTR